MHMPSRQDLGAEDPRELETAQLVRELMVHGKRLFEVEARLLRADLQRELSQAREDLRADAGAIVGESRARLAGGVAALKRDLREQADRAKSAAKPMAAGGVLLHAAVLVLVAALVLGLGTQMPLWAAALVTGLVTAGAGALLLSWGKHAAKQVGRNPLNRTNRQMTETKRWMNEMKERLASRMRALKSGLSDDVWPRLRRSFAGEPVRLTSRTRLETP